MRAGLLREKVTFYGYVKTVSETGAERRTLQELCTVRMYRRKKDEAASDLAHEEFITSHIILQGRQDVRFKNADSLAYAGARYNIVSMLPNIEDHSVTIKATKINK